MILGFDFLKFSQMYCDIGKGTIGFKFLESEVACVLSDIGCDTENFQLEESDMTESQKLKLQRIISSYEDVLTTKLGRASCSPYEIRIKGNPQPTQSRPYQCTPVRMQALKKIENMFADIKDYVRSCPECQLSKQYSV